MRPTHNLMRLAVCLSSLAPLASAWPGWLPDRDSLIVARQDDSETTASETGTQTSAAEEPEETDEAEESSSTRRDLNTAEPTKSDSEETGSRTKTSDDDEPSRTTFGLNDPAGGVNIQNPPTMVVATPLFKIGDNVTLGWNYTSLQGTPTAIDVILSCSAASQTWVLAENMTFETSVDFYWDTRDQESDSEAPLGTEMYNLIIKDSDSDVGDRAEPGYLGAFADFTFGMYVPAEPTPWDEFIRDCTVCKSAAPGALTTSATGLALTMGLAALGFTWLGL